MSEDPLVFEQGGCPVCGNDIVFIPISNSGADIIAQDGDHCFCSGNCGWHGTISADDGEAWAQPSDEVESLVNVIEEQRIRIARARDHLLRIFPTGDECNHADARQVFLALAGKGVAA